VCFRIGRYRRHTEIVGHEELRRVPLFAGLSDERCVRVAAATTARSVPAGTMLALEGEPCDPLHIVEAGRAVALRTSPSGRLARVRVDDAPVAIDKATALAGTRHLFTWLTLTHCRVRALPRKLFLELVATEMSVTLQTARHLATQTNQARSDYLDAAVHEPRTRLMNRLEEMADHTGAVRLEGGQEGLAAELGLARLTVTRTLRGLADEGLIHVGRGYVQLRDHNR